MFLHGYLCSGGIFVSQTKFFSRYFDCYAPDLKGFGENEMEYPYSLDDYVADLKEYIQANGIVKPCVVAHSFGARLVIKYLSKYPDAFGKIVITGGAGLKPRRSLKYRLKRLVFKVCKLFAPRERLKRFYSADYNVLSAVMKESFIKVVNEHLDGYLKGIKNQTLLIYGEKDNQTPPYMAKKMNKGLENSKLSIYKNTGHFCFLDCPNKFNMEVREFLLSE